MKTTLLTNIPANSIPPAFSASDNSGAGLSWSQGARQNGQKKAKNQKNNSYFSGTLSADTWSIYADLASLMDAISLVQTQGTFLEKANIAVLRLERLIKNPKNSDSNSSKHSKYELSKFVSDMLNRTELQSDRIRNSSTKEIPLNNTKHLITNNLSAIDEWESFEKMTRDRLETIKSEHDHLIDLAKNARLKIQKNNHSSLMNEKQCLDKATIWTVNELKHHSFRVYKIQTDRLPKNALRLINN